MWTAWNGRGGWGTRCWWQSTPTRRCGGWGRAPAGRLRARDARVTVVAALECVDWVTTFDEDTPERLIAELQPDVLVKGGDYSPDQVAGAGTVSARGGRVVIAPFVPGHSTNNLVRRIRGPRAGGGP